MRLHLLRGDLDFHWLQPADGAPWTWHGGTPVAGDWQVPRLVLAEGDPAEEFLAVDCLPMNTGCDGPVLSEFARTALAGLFEPCGEFWPVDVLAHRYWWFNCLESVDALDPDATEAEWGTIESDEGVFRWILAPQRLAFQSGRLATAPPVFRVPEFPHGTLFADDRVEQAIAQSALTGFKLDLVWSSEEGGVEHPAGFDFGEAWGAAPVAAVRRKRAAARAVLRDRTG